MLLNRAALGIYLTKQLQDAVWMDNWKKKANGWAMWKTKLRAESLAAHRQLIVGDVSYLPLCAVYCTSSIVFLCVVDCIWIDWVEVFRAQARS